MERHRIKVPTLGWVRLKEKGYISTKANVKSCTLTQQADRFYISVMVEEPDLQVTEPTYTDGVGVDLGLKYFAITSEGHPFKNINKSSAVKRVEKRLKRAQRALSRKLESRKKRGEKSAAGGGSNISKNVLRVQKLYARLKRMREAYHAWVVSMLVKTKPAYITIEKLHVKGMMSNRHLSRAVANQGFYSFKQKLLNACRKYGIQLREADTFYPSSKMCSCYGYVKKNLSLSERIFHCESCSHEINRDSNAVINLMQAKEYVVLT